jgi:hypothetical protein
LRDEFHQHAFVSRARGKVSIKSFASVGKKIENFSPRVAKACLFHFLRRSIEAIRE